jgi:hypothetical protein
MDRGVFVGYFVRVLRVLLPDCGWRVLIHDEGVDWVRFGVVVNGVGVCVLVVGGVVKVAAQGVVWRGAWVVVDVGDHDGVVGVVRDCLRGVGFVGVGCG